MAKQHGCYKRAPVVLASVTSATPAQKTSGKPCTRPRVAMVALNPPSLQGQADVLAFVQTLPAK